jgi:hypothetical protein
MVAPIVAAGLRYALGQGLENAGLPSGLANPKGYITGQIAQGVDKALGVTPGLTGAIVNPKGTAAGAIRDMAKDALTGGGENPSMPESRERDSEYYGGGLKRGGKVKKMASGGMTSKVSSASRRGDGIAQRGKTKGRML